MSRAELIAALAGILSASGVWWWVRRRIVNTYRWALRKLGLSDEQIDRAVEDAKRAAAEAKKARKK